MEIGLPSFSKWTVIAVYALWLGDVQASVAKLSAPTCSFFYLYYFIDEHAGDGAHLQHLCDMFANSYEDIPGIFGYSLRRRDRVFRPTGLHEVAKATVRNYFERAFTFCYPPNNFSPGSAWVQIGKNVLSIKVCHLPGFG